MIGRLLRERFSDILVMFAVVAVLTGCAVSPPRPVEVSLDRSKLEVRLSNGEICTGEVDTVPVGPERTTVSGTGTLQGCSTVLEYTVTGDTRTNPVRMLLEEVFTAIGLPDAVAPAAEVSLAAPDGRRWHFVSPPEREDD